MKSSGSARSVPVPFIHSLPRGLDLGRMLVLHDGSTLSSYQKRLAHRSEELYLRQLVACCALHQVAVVLLDHRQ